MRQGDVMKEVKVWEEYKGKESFCSLFTFKWDGVLLLQLIIQVVLLLKYIACENKPLTNYIEYITLYVSINIFVILILLEVCCFRVTINEVILNDMFLSIPYKIFF